MIRKAKVVIFNNPTQRTDWVWGMIFGKKAMYARFNQGTVCAGSFIKRPVTLDEGDGRKEDSKQSERKGGWKTVVQISSVRYGKCLTLQKERNDGNRIVRTDEGVQVLP